MMRRNDKEIRDTSLMEAILEEAAVCRLGMCVDNMPYVVPMNFAYQDRTLYLHAASDGKKTGMIKANPAVCFEVDCRTEIVPSEKACNWGMKYYSIIGFGKAFFVEGRRKKTEALDLIMKKYSGRSGHVYPEISLDNTAVIRIEISEMTGKMSGY